MTQKCYCDWTLVWWWFRIRIGLCFEHTFRIGFGYYWNFADRIGSSNFNIHTKLLAMDHACRCATLRWGPVFPLEKAWFADSPVSMSGSSSSRSYCAEPTCKLVMSLCLWYDNQGISLLWHGMEGKNRYGIWNDSSMEWNGKNCSFSIQTRHLRCIFWHRVAEVRFFFQLNIVAESEFD